MNFYVYDHGYDMSDYLLLKIGDKYMRCGILKKRGMHIYACRLYYDLEDDTVNLINPSMIRNLKDASGETQNAVDDEILTVNFRWQQKSWLKGVFNK